jgi:hypothetical protein
VIAQIGAVKIGLEGEFPLLDTLKVYVTPHDRHGTRYAIASYFTDLTGTTEEQITRHGKPFQTALDDLERFSEGATFWSWGKDELNMIAISCYVALSRQFPRRGLITP